MAPHSSTLLPGKSHGRRSLVGSLRVWHDWTTSLSLFIFMHWIKKWHPTPVLFCLENPMDGGAWWAAVHGVAKSLAQLNDFSLSCIGERNGNPLQCSCLENPRDGGAWWAVVYGVAQHRTWLKSLSSSSITKIVMLKSPIVSVDLSISSHDSLNFCFTFLSLCY